MHTSEVLIKRRNFERNAKEYKDMFRSKFGGKKYSLNIY